MKSPYILNAADVPSITASAFPPAQDIVMHDLRITKDGIIFKGQRIEDAGQVHAALREVMHGAAPSVDHLARACNLAGIAYTDFLRIRAYLPIQAEQPSPGVERRRDLQGAKLPLDVECALEHAALALNKAGEQDAHAHVTDVVRQHLPADANHVPVPTSGTRDALYPGYVRPRSAAQLHPDDAAVDRFAAEMKAKMASSRAKGRDGWDNPDLCSAAQLNAMLVEHLAKGDPMDVATFAMMLWNRRERTAAMSPTTATDIDLAQLDKLEALALAATRGPWKRSERPNGPFWHISSEFTIDGERCKSGRQAIGALHAENKRGAPKYAAMFEANATFVAAANPATMLQLIALARHSLSNGVGRRDPTAEMLDMLGRIHPFAMEENERAKAYKRLERAYCIQQPWPVPDQACIVWRGDLMDMHHDLIHKQACFDSERAKPASPELTVWYGTMPESNGKSNFTALLMRKGGDFVDGITIDRSEYPDRVRYEADRVRYLIGELVDRPDILDYDANKHSGYKQPVGLDLAKSLRATTESKGEAS